MRILHTSDWHLGKMLGSKSRLSEQREALERLAIICQQEKIDVLLVCGDIFDTFVPKAEAEELFFEQLVKLSRLCTVVCLSGNHDDGDRLKAPGPVAVYSDIFLVGGMDNRAFTRKNVVGGDGWLRFNIRGERLNLALLPYPFFSGIISQTEGSTNEERISRLTGRCCSCFAEGEVNVFASHLYAEGGEVAEERELGTAPVLPVHVLPCCDYVALGHIHKPQFVNKSRRIVYSGSLLKYSFDDTFDKYFYIFDSDGGDSACESAGRGGNNDKSGVFRNTCGSVKRVEAAKGKSLVTAIAESFDETEKALTDNPDAYVKIIYRGNPLELSQIKRIKSYACFTDIKFENQRDGVKKTVKADASPEELFKTFYQSQAGENPDKELTELFLSILVN